MFELELICEVLQCVVVFWCELCDVGYVIVSIDVGGGLGVCYCFGVDWLLIVVQYVDVICEVLVDFDGWLLLEFGCWLVVEVGVLLIWVVCIKFGVQ